MTECKCDGNCGSIPLGWKCPECGKVNAPHVDVCWHEKHGKTPAELLDELLAKKDAKTSDDNSELLREYERFKRDFEKYPFERSPWRCPVYPDPWYNEPFTPLKVWYAEIDE